MIEYTWRVFKQNRFAGYIRAFSEIEAIQKASKEYGSSYLLLERTPYLRNNEDKEYILDEFHQKI